jgi:hypothetical protein
MGGGVYIREFFLFNDRHQLRAVLTSLRAPKPSSYLVPMLELHIPSLLSFSNCTEWRTVPS